MMSSGGSGSGCRSGGVLALSENAVGGPLGSRSIATPPRSNRRHWVGVGCRQCSFAQAETVASVGNEDVRHGRRKEADTRSACTLAVVGVPSLDTGKSVS